MRKILSFVIIFLVLLGTISCSKNVNKGAKTSNDQQEYITIATGDTSGPYFTIGEALAKVYKKKLQYKTAIQSTDGSVENMKLLENHQVDLAFVMSDAASFALLKNNKEQDGAPHGFKAIAGLYPNYVQIVTLGKNKIKSVSDLKGKRIGVGAPNSGVEANARIILKEYGITYNDIEPEYLSYEEAMEQLKDNHIDAAFVTSGLPNNAVLRLQKSEKVMIVPMQTSDINHLTKKFPFFERSEIPAGIYQNTHPIPTVAIRNILLVRSDLSEDQVYKMTKTFFDNLNVLQNAHQAANSINRKDAGKGLVIPLHSGAKKYFKEINDK